jgi:hypothetical protein
VSGQEIVFPANVDAEKNTSAEVGAKRLELSDRLDQVLIDCDKIRSVFIVDDDIGQADEETRFFIDRIGDTIPHWRDQKVSHVGTIDRPYADADFLPFGHGSLLPPRRLRLAFSTKKFLALAQLFVLVLTHLLSSLFQDA